MCGIIGGIAQRDITPILVEGLKRLEYRGYDSAGLAVLESAHKDPEIHCVRVCGKVNDLAQTLNQSPILGSLGIAQTRWATHGKPSTENAHPQMSGDDLALVHNGIIDNYEELKEELKSKGVIFKSQTDTEVIVHLIHLYMNEYDFLEAVQKALVRLTGSFALAIMSKNSPDRLIVARKGSPLLIGLGIGENFVASDMLALFAVTQQFVMLEEGDVAILYKDHYEILDSQNKRVTRPIRTPKIMHGSTEKGAYRHFMLKEIFEQPLAAIHTLQGRLALSDEEMISDTIFNPSMRSDIDAILSAVKQVQIVACGTSYHAGMVAKFWIENLVGIPCQVDIASEVRYHKQLARPGTLWISLSQSGETADTLGALRSIQKNEAYCGRIAICNVAESSLVRESDFTLLTQAGPEIGVASTKAFTTQLVALLMLVFCLGRRFNLSVESQKMIAQSLREMPAAIEQVLLLDKPIQALAQQFARKKHALFLGRGIHYPVAREGALKLKEISYIHAEAYPAGELKHGPLALVDKNMPVIALLPNDELVEKLKSNLEEVSARGGEVIVFAESGVKVSSHMKVLFTPTVNPLLSPLIMTIPLQLLSYHVAVLKGTDVDQPRNLAKSVTVE